MLDGAVREGVIRFIYSSSPELAPVRERLAWGTEGVKELNLTHNLIASQAGFAGLMDIYDGDRVLAFVRRICDYIKENTGEIDPINMTFGEVVDALQIGKSGAALRSVSPTNAMNDYIAQNPSAMLRARATSYEQISHLYVSKDQLLDDTKNAQDDISGPGSQRDELIQHLFRIQNCLQAYQAGQYGEFVRLTDFKLRSNGDKATLKRAIEELAGDRSMCIGDAIRRAASSGLVQVDDRLMRFR
jgi:DNA helicase-2/ATP-dependent DNA helicase PcrA